MDITPLIFDDSSLRALLTWDLPAECHEGGPVSIITLLTNAGLKDCYFVAPNFHSYMKAMKACEKHGIAFHFGLELWVTDNAKQLDEQSRAAESKIIVWQKNSAGYKDIVRLNNRLLTHADQFYYHNRADWKGVKEHWTDNLSLSLPFFDSFLARNTLNYGSQIVPDLPVVPSLFREVATGHPHEFLISRAIDRYAEGGACEVINTKTCYYARYADMKAYMIRRCIGNHSKMDDPDLSYFCSNQFCWESYLEARKETVQFPLDIAAAT